MFREFAILTSPSLRQSSTKNQQCRAFRIVADYIITTNRVSPGYSQAVLQSIVGLVNAADSEVEVRLAAEDALNRILKELMGTRESHRILVELLKLFKIHESVRCRRIALESLASFITFARPSRARAFAAAIFPPLLEASNDPNESLATSLDKICAVLMPYFADSEVQQLLQVFLQNLSSESPVIRRYSCNCLKSIVRYHHGTFPVDIIIRELHSLWIKYSSAAVADGDEGGGGVLGMLECMSELLVLTTDEKPNLLKSHEFLMSRIILRCVKSVQMVDRLLRTALDTLSLLLDYLYRNGSETLNQFIETVGSCLVETRKVGIVGSALNCLRPLALFSPDLISEKYSNELIAYSKAEDPLLRSSSCSVMSCLVTKKSVFLTTIRTLVNDEAATVRQAALDGMSQYPHKFPELLEKCESWEHSPEYWRVMVSGYRSMGNMVGDHRSINILIRALCTTDERVRREAALSLSKVAIFGDKVCSMVSVASTLLRLVDNSGSVHDKAAWFALLIIAQNHGIEIRALSSDIIPVLLSRMSICEDLDECLTCLQMICCIFDPAISEFDPLAESVLESVLKILNILAMTNNGVEIDSPIYSRLLIAKKTDKFNSLQSASLLALHSCIMKLGNRAVYSAGQILDAITAMENADTIATIRCVRDMFERVFGPVESLGYGHINSPIESKEAREALLRRFDLLVSAVLDRARAVLSAPLLAETLSLCSVLVRDGIEYVRLDQDLVFLAGLVQRMAPAFDWNMASEPVLFNAFSLLVTLRKFQPKVITETRLGELGSAVLHHVRSDQSLSLAVIGPLCNFAFHSSSGKSVSATFRGKCIEWLLLCLSGKAAVICTKSLRFLHEYLPDEWNQLRKVVSFATLNILSNPPTADCDIACTADAYKNLLEETTNELDLLCKSLFELGNLNIASIVSLLDRISLFSVESIILATNGMNFAEFLCVNMATSSPLLVSSLLSISKKLCQDEEFLNSFSLSFKSTFSEPSEFFWKIADELCSGSNGEVFARLVLDHFQVNSVTFRIWLRYYNTLEFDTSSLLHDLRGRDLITLLSTFSPFESRWKILQVISDIPYSISLRKPLRKLIEKAMTGFTDLNEIPEDIQILNVLKNCGKYLARSSAVLHTIRVLWHYFSEDYRERDPNSFILTREIALHGSKSQICQLADQLCLLCSGEFSYSLVLSLLDFLTVCRFESLRVAVAASKLVRSVLEKGYMVTPALLQLIKYICRHVHNNNDNAEAVKEIILLSSSIWPFVFQYADRIDMYGLDSDLEPKKNARLAVVLPKRALSVDFSQGLIDVITNIGYWREVSGSMHVEISQQLHNQVRRTIETPIPQENPMEKMAEAFLGESEPHAPLSRSKTVLPPLAGAPPLFGHMRSRSWAPNRVKEEEEEEPPPVPCRERDIGLASLQFTFGRISCFMLACHLQSSVYVCYVCGKGGLNGLPFSSFEQIWDSLIPQLNEHIPSVPSSDVTSKRVRADHTLTSYCHSNVFESDNSGLYRTRALNALISLLVIAQLPKHVPRESCSLLHNTRIGLQLACSRTLLETEGLRKNLVLPFRDFLNGESVRPFAASTANLDFKCLCPLHISTERLANHNDERILLLGDEMEDPVWFGVNNSEYDTGHISARVQRLTEKNSDFIYLADNLALWCTDSALNSTLPVSLRLTAAKSAVILTDLVSTNTLLHLCPYFERMCGPNLQDAAQSVGKSMAKTTKEVSTLIGSDWKITPADDSGLVKYGTLGLCRAAVGLCMSSETLVARQQSNLWMDKACIAVQIALSSQTDSFECSQSLEIFALDGLISLIDSGIETCKKNGISVLKVLGRGGGGVIALILDRLSNFKSRDGVPWRLVSRVLTVSSLLVQGLSPLMSICYDTDSLLSLDSTYFIDSLDWTEKNRHLPSIRTNLIPSLRRATRDLFLDCIHFISIGVHVSLASSIMENLIISGCMKVLHTPGIPASLSAEPGLKSVINGFSQIAFDGTESSVANQKARMSVFLCCSYLSTDKGLSSFAGLEPLYSPTESSVNINEKLTSILPRLKTIENIGCVKLLESMLPKLLFDFLSTDEVLSHVLTELIKSPTPRMMEIVSQVFSLFRSDGQQSAVTKWVELCLRNVSQIKSKDIATWSMMGLLLCSSSNVQDRVDVLKMKGWYGEKHEVLLERVDEGKRERILKEIFAK